MVSKMKEFFRFLKFLFFSISAGLIQIGSFTLFTEVIKWEYWTCYLISLILSVIWNLTFNRKFTFKSSNNYFTSLLLVLLYYSIFTPITTIGGHYLVKYVAVNKYIVEISSMILNFITEFLYQRFIVFGKTIDDRDNK